MNREKPASSGRNLLRTENICSLKRDQVHKRSDTEEEIDKVHPFMKFPHFGRIK